MNLQKSIAALLIIGGLTAGCSSKMLKNPGGVSYSTEPTVLELRGDSISFVNKVTFGEKYFAKKAVLTATPVLNYAGTNADLTPVKFKGESAEGAGRTVPNATGGSYSAAESIAYKKGMEKAEMNVKVNVAIGSKSVDFPLVKLADGTIVTAQRLKTDYRTAQSADNFKEVAATQRATIFFLINDSDVRNSEKKKAEIQAMADFMQKGYQIREIVINGYASPDGELQRNDKLADQRAKGANDFVFKTLIGKKGMTKLYDDNFYKESTATEDWNGLLALIQNENIPNKAEVIAIINSGKSSEEKQEDLRQLNDAYKVLADKYLPQLRRAEMVINAVEPIKSDSMLIAMALKDSAKLTANEMIKAARLAKNDADRTTILNNAAKAYSGDYRAHNNLAALALDKNDLAAARTHLNSASAANANAAEVLNNQGVLAGKEGDYKKAKDFFTKAGNAGVNVDYNQGVAAVRAGDYSLAVSKLGSGYNKALALILNKNYPAATAELDAIQNLDASGHYLKAIIGARTDNRDMMTTGLTRSVALDAAMRDLAKGDAEFIKHHNQDYFKVAIR